MALFAGFIHAAEKPTSLDDHAASGTAQSMPTLKPDPALRAVIEKVLETSAHNGYLIHDTKDKTLVVASLQIDQPPADMAFDVTLRSGEHIWCLGPMAWGLGERRQWAYNVDLPETVTHVDMVFTPSARAGMAKSLFPRFPLIGLFSIWSGEPIVIKELEIRSGDISMIKQSPPGNEEAREHLISALSPDSDQARQLAGGMSLSEMRKRLDEEIAKPNPAPETRFALGCVLIAQGQLDEGMNTLLKARGVVDLEDRLQHELRYICARWLYAADNGSLAEMFSLGRAYEEGNGVGQDVQQAKYWFRKAANAGHDEAMARLAVTKPLAPSASIDATKMLAVYRAQAAEWQRQSTPTYHDWVERHVRKTLQARYFYTEGDDLKLVFSVINNDNEGEERSTHEGTGLWANGRSYSFFCNNRGSYTGGSGGRIPADKLALIDQIISRLPDDHGVLPPRNRRLVVQAANKPENLVRVFDLANPPPDICELMRILHTGPAYVPRFQAYSSIDVCGHEQDGALAVAPQNEILYSGRRNRLQWWNPTTHEFIAEVDIANVENIVLAPDKVHALAQTSSDIVLIDLPGRKSVRTFKYRYGAQFTQDGRHVLLNSQHGPMQILDTQSWEPVDHADDVPKNCTNIFPAPTTHRSLVRAVDGSVTLWDTAGNRPVKQLCSESDVRMFAAFSPDESLVALCVHPWQQNFNDIATFVIYKSDTGEKVHELHPFETGGSRESIQSLLWTPDGAYVLAATGSNGGGGAGICLFNAATGKHRGELIGPIQINGMGLLARSGELVAGDQYGKIWFWDLSAVIKNVREFEATLK